MTFFRGVDPLEHDPRDVAGVDLARVMRRMPASCISVSLPANDSWRLVRKNAGQTTETSMSHGSELEHQRLADGDDAGLRGVVARHAGPVDEAGERGDVDDVAAALLLEERGERVAPARHAEQVDVDDALPVGDRLDVDAATRRDPGVVDEDVEAAPLLAHPGQRRVPVLLGAHVEPAVGGGVGHARRSLVGEVDDEHGVAAPDHELGEGQAEARGASGDEDATAHRGLSAVSVAADAAGDLPEDARSAASAYGRSRCRATTPRCTSSGPSARRRLRAPA